ncbi:AMP-dependent synthetase/ligase [Penicillium occitanis (nom. inval.)]|nr:AMP-dependent synthetase/ligase [Penicillium occitanis (nom. inval.)]
MYIGAIFTIINPMFTIKEIASAIELIGPRMIFVSRRLGFRKNDEIFQMVSSLSTNAEKTVQVVYMRFETSEYGSAPSYTQFVEREKVINKHQDLERDVHVKTDDVCCFQFTSGTTGPRKVNFINNGQLAGNLLELTEKDIRCRPPPLFHWFGLVCGLLAAVSHGRTLVLPSEVFDPTKVIETLVKEKCTVFNAVPTMFQSILDQEALSAKVSSQLSLRTGIIAAASLSRDLLQRINDRLALNGLIYPFGMTELSAVSLSTTRDISLLSNWTTVGKPLPHTSIKVIDTDGTVLPPGRSGELCLSGYLVHKGYFKVPEKSAEVAQIDENGTARLHTGDIVSLAPDGICTVLGRVKDMIKKVNAPERRDQISLAGPHCSKPEH